MDSSPHRAIILLGSNINPVENIRQAISMLCKNATTERISTVWETAAIESNGPNFLNAAILLLTDQTLPQLKDLSLRPIETSLGRIRTQDKNAPRTIDLDVIVFNNEIIEPNIWSRLYIALPVAEIASHLVNPDNKKSLVEIANDLLHQGWAKHHPEINLSDDCNPFHFKGN